MPENTVSDVEQALMLTQEAFDRLPSIEDANFLDAVQQGSQSVFLGMPLLADVDLIVTSEDWKDVVLTIAAQPDVPRNITVTLTDANDSVTGVCTIVGTDARGRAVTEVMTIAVGGVGKVFTGTKIFGKVTSATITGSAGELNGTDVVTVGVGKVIGTPFDMDSDATVHHVYLNGIRIASPVLTTGEATSGIDVSAGTYDGAKWMQAFIEISSAT